MAMTLLRRLTTIVGTVAVLTLAGGLWAADAVAATVSGSGGDPANVPFGAFEATSNTGLDDALVTPLTAVRLQPTLEQRRGRGGSRAGRAGRAAPRGRAVRGPGRRTVVVRNRYYPYYGYYGAYGYPYYGYGWGYGGYPYYGGGYYGGTYDYTGSLRLKVKPRDAEVLVDGYFVGRVDEFDGSFQSLRLEPGGKHIEIRSPGFASLSFDVRILPGRKTTYEANMQAGDPGPPPTPTPPPSATRPPARSPRSGVAVDPPSTDRGQGPPPGYDQAPPSIGGVRLKVQPRNAQVFVDGFFVGTVDDFDGGRGLPLESGPQRLEIRADGYEPMEIQVRILPNETITYEGELTPMGSN